MLNEARAIELLANGGFSFPPLTLTEFEVEPVDGTNGQPDWMLGLQWKGRTKRFGVAYKSVPTPKRLEDAVDRAKRYGTGRLRPMIMAPYLDESWLNRLARQEVSGLDFSGNGVVVLPGEWFIYRSGEPNAFPSSQYIKAIYRGRSSFVPRVLLVRRRFDRVSDIKEEIERRGGTISLGTVSKVLTKLEEDLLISREDGVKVLQPSRLLQRLTDEYAPPEVTRRWTGRSEDLERTLESIMTTAEERRIDVAGRGERIYTVFPGAEKVLSVYTEDAEVLESALDLEETRRFADLELLETADETVYFDRRRRDGFVWTSPIQTYLELATGRQREQQTAEQLRDDLLEGAGI